MRAWQPGTSRWAYLITGFYGVFLVAGLPVTIALNIGPGWLTFSLLLASEIANVSAARVMRRDARRRTASAGAGGTWT